jgi:hypothetical protein
MEKQGMTNEELIDTAYTAGYTNALMQLQTHIRQFEVKDVKRVLEFIDLMNETFEKIVKAVEDERGSLEQHKG